VLGKHPWLKAFRRCRRTDTAGTVPSRGPAPRQGRFRSTRGYACDELLDPQHGVAPQALTDRSARRFLRIVGYLPQLRTVRQIRAINERVIAEHRSADHHHEVVAGQLLRQRALRKRQPAQIERMSLWERGTL
jgi:hypothetical protein